MPTQTILEYKDVLRQVKLGDLHVLLLDSGRLKHVLRIAAEWRPKKVMRHPTGRFEKRLYCDRG